MSPRPSRKLRLVTPFPSTEGDPAAAPAAAAPKARASRRRALAECGDELPGAGVPQPPGIDRNDDRLRAFAERYYAWMHAAHFSQVSLHTKRSALNRFFIWCEDRGVERLGDVTPGVTEGYQRYLFEYRNAKTGRPLGVRTQVQMLECVRTLFKWLLKKRFLATNPATAIDLPRMPFRIPKAVFTLAEIEKILAGIDTTKPQGLRDRTIFEVFYSSGIRRLELRQLKAREIDFESGMMRIIGKGDKERIVPVGDRALNWVKRYLEEARPLLLGAELDPEFLFITQNGTQISLNYLTHLTGERVRKAKIGKPGACHAFRHSFATHLLENDVDIRLIQGMMGHALLETTSIYTHVAVKKLKDAHTAKHPAARMKKAPAKINAPEKPTEPKATPQSDDEEKES